MDTQTLFVAIGIAFLTFALLLIVAERPPRHSPMSLLTAADLLFGVGVLLQSARETLPFALTVAAGNLLAWIGMEYQCWAALTMSGRSVSTRFQIWASAVTLFAGLLIVAAPPVARVTASTLVYAILFALTAWTLISWRDAPRNLRAVTAGLFIAVSVLYTARAVGVAAGALPPAVFGPGDGIGRGAAFVFLLIFAGILGGAFSLLLLLKRATDLQLQALLNETEALLSTLPTGVAITAGGRITRVNPTLAAMLGYEPSELEGQHGSILFASASHYDAAIAPVLAQLQLTGTYQGEFEIIDRTGEHRATWLQVSAVDWDPTVRHAVYSLTDISALKALQAEIARQAAYDELTGLLNRRAFLQRAHLELARAKRNGRPVALATLDLDRLKMINDGHGHAAGDQALIAVADAFRQTFRDVDLTARVGGDEFAVILPDSDLAQARAAMERFLSNLARADLRVDDSRIELGASVGVAEYAQPESLDELLARADRAMYASKHRGGQAVTARGADPLDPGDGRADSRTP